jgi:hypothetical protein
MSTQAIPDRFLFQYHVHASLDKSNALLIEIGPYPAERIGGSQPAREEKIRAKQRPFPKNTAGQRK